MSMSSVHMRCHMSGPHARRRKWTDRRAAAGLRRAPRTHIITQIQTRARRLQMSVTPGLEQSVRERTRAYESVTRAYESVRELSDAKSILGARCAYTAVPSHASSHRVGSVQFCARTRSHALARARTRSHGPWWSSEHVDTSDRRPRASSRRVLLTPTSTRRALCRVSSRVQRSRENP